MSAPNEKGSGWPVVWKSAEEIRAMYDAKSDYPPEFAADLHKLDCLKAARLLRDPANLAELNSPEFAELFAAVTDFRWSNPDVDPDAFLGDDKAEKEHRDTETRAINEAAR